MYFKIVNINNIYKSCRNFKCDDKFTHYELTYAGLMDFEGINVDIKESFLID